MDELTRIFHRAAEHAAAYRRSLPERPVAEPVDHAALRAAFARPLNRSPADPLTVVDELVAAAGPGLVATAGPRFFGFVVGGALPAATAAEILAAGWDQNAFNAALSPAALAAEEAAAGRLKDLLGIPGTASTGFVTGGQAANTAGLAAARQHLLTEAGWDIGRRGLHGAPRLRVVAGEERHATVDRSLRLLGLGTDCLETVRTDARGAVDTEDLRRVLTSGPGGPLIVCAQAGNVNTGACDDLRAVCDLAHAHGGWVHVDGAFGLWAAASPATRHLVAGVERADSWACDGHKWLNVPYDCGYAFCSRPDVHADALSYTASYLTRADGTVAGGADYTTESSRRARGFATWAALRQLGRDGVAALVERCCSLARRFADGLSAAGFEVVNEVTLNQVLVAFGDGTRTDRIVRAVQEDGTCWMGATTWRGRRLMRISVSGHTTTEADVDRSIAAIVRLARAL
ncbi:pyridoxal phosphate-dependent decarboxylase family protein [Streptomyces dubilierae]|uniref:Pyridoxal-dependent decarboxylase n=1 Tax=Streptomyces dubilierae TaxID=3075533 RepID=A0ABU2PIX6_9ACTN|nr:pyridoxal-dependent decarboxylase [Streptomyces sp. DSM 41921]MDT0392113.1 pyridoxal-dependent decarboxylase [Streptomyces sp. DSM 41921]